MRNKWSLKFAREPGLWRVRGPGRSMFMKTTLPLIVFGLLAWVWEPRAQQAVEAAAPIRTGSLLSPISGAEQFTAITLDSSMPVLDALRALGDEAGYNFTLAPELMVNGQPIRVLTGPVGEFRMQNMSPREAFEYLVASNQLLFGASAESGQPMLGTLDSIIIPLASEGIDLAGGPPPVVALESFFDPNREIPLLTAVQMLGRLSRLNIMIDRRVRTGGTRIVGTNVVQLEAVGTNVVTLSAYEGVTPRQTLEALLENYDLMMRSDPKTGFSKVTFKDPDAKEPTFTYVQQLHFSSPTNMVELLHSTFPQTIIRADSRTAQLVISSTQSEYEAMTNLLASLDTPTKQVLIEARFLETLINPKSVKGIDWTDTLQGQNVAMGNGTVNYSQGSTTTTTTPGAAATGTLPSGRPVTTTAGSTSQRTDTVTQQATSGSGISLNTSSGFQPSTAFLNADGVKLVLSYLNTEADSRVLATPRAVTMDNQETKLEVTRSIPVFDSTDAVGQGGATVSSTKPNYTNVGTILIVTPRISGTNVSMKLRPEISKVEPLPSRKVVAGKINEADIFATSRIETQVLVPSGNTLVMGGLISDSTFKNFTKVPLLGDIPLLGWAFRKESKERIQGNLIIFITPTIIETDDYQPTRTEFLNTPIPDLNPAAINENERGRPKDWSSKGKEGDAKAGPKGAAKAADAKKPAATK